MLNHITVMGRLTRDPELRRTNSGTAVASFTVAVDRDYAPEGQEKETDFIDCVAWRNTGEFVSKYFTKGRMIVVSGRLQIRSWTDKDGNKRRTAEIVADSCYFGDSKKDDGQAQDSRNSQSGSNTPKIQNGYPGGYGGAPHGFSGYPQQGYSQYGQPASNVPNYAQQGFGGYQQPGYSAPGYQPSQGVHVPYAPIEGDDTQLPF